MLAVASFLDITAGEWSSAIDRARQAIALASDPGEGLAGAAYIPLAIGLMVSDPDAADQVIDEGVQHIRRARAPLWRGPRRTSSERDRVGKLLPTRFGQRPERRRVPYGTFGKC